MSKYDTDALFAELEAMQAKYKMATGHEFSVRQAPRTGFPVYICKTANGHHESAESYEHALFLLVDSFRTRIEDTEAVHLRIQAWDGVAIKTCRKIADSIAKEVLAANPGMPGEERDALVLAALDDEESNRAADKSEAEAIRIDHIAKGGVRR